MIMNSIKSHNTKNKILIIGGTGFLGYHLAKFFLKKNYQVTSLSLNKPKTKRFIKKVIYIKCDIGEKQKLERKIKTTYEYIINCGGYVNHSNKKQNYKTHFLGVKNLSTIFFNKKIKKFIQIGSSLEYGKISSPNFEKKLCKPQLSYGKFKFQSTKYLLDKNKKLKFPATVIRLYQLYGPHQDKNRFIPFIISKSLNNESYPCSEGKQKRDFLYITDAVEGIYKALKNKKLSGRVINLGFGRPYKLKVIINKIRSKIKKGNPEFGRIKMRKEEQLVSYPNINLAKKYLNWKPKTSLNEGLNLTIKYFKSIKELKK